MVNLQETEATLLDVKAESRIHAARAEVLETELRSRAIAAQTFENEISSLGARLSTAEKSLEASGRERDGIARELSDAREQLIGASAQIEEARTKMAEQERSAERMQQTIEELQKTREISVTALAEKAQEIDNLLARITEAEAQYQTHLMEKDAELDAARERTAEIEEQWGEQGVAKNRLLEEHEDSQRTLRERELELGQLKDAAARLEGQLQEDGIGDLTRVDGERAKTGRAVLASDDPSAEDLSDDLKQISGIGPKLELLLHGLGVHTFRQVALWSEEDIERVDAQLERFRGRIRREHWVEGAREEFQRKYGTQPEED